MECTQGVPSVVRGIQLLPFDPPFFLLSYNVIPPCSLGTGRRAESAMQKSHRDLLQRNAPAGAHAHRRVLRF